MVRRETYRIKRLNTSSVYGRIPRIFLYQRETTRFFMAMSPTRTFHKMALLICLSLVAVIGRAEEPLRLQVWHQMIYSHREVLAEVLKEFEKLHPDIQVRPTYRETEELRSAYQSAAMGGSGPELIYGPSDQIGPFAEMGIISPLESEFDDSFFNQFDPLAVPLFKQHRYAIGDSVGNHLMLLYNRKLVAAPPKDSDELIKISESLTKDLNGDGKIDQWGLVFNYTEPFFFVPWIAGFGENFLSADFSPQLNTASTAEAFQFIRDLKVKYKVIPPECDYELANALFKEGRAAFLVNGDWSWGDYIKAGVDFGVAPLPKISATGLWPAPLVSTKGYSLNSNVKDPRRKAAALLLIRYLVSPEVQMRFAEKVGTLPSLLELRSKPQIANHPLLSQSGEIMSHAQPMPLVPEIRAVWDVLRRYYQAVLGGSVEPREAARLAQTEAEKQIAVMNEVIQPGPVGVALKWIGNICLLLLLLWSIYRTPILIKSFREKPAMWAMMLPGLIAIFAVILYPFFYNLVIAFSNFSLKTFRSWDVVGIQNFISVFSDPQFYSILVKTILWTATNVIAHVSLGVALALLIDQVLPAKPLWRVLLIIPWAVPQYITALTWRGLFHQEYGPINLFLQQYLHLSPVQWLSQPFTAFFACFVTNVWLGFPFMMVVALGGLQSIPNTLYEAARLDGASSLQRFRFITWPLLRPVMTPAALLGCIWTFNNLNVVWLVSNTGEPADQTHILVSYVYKAAFNLYRYGYAAALSVIIFLLLLVYGLWALRRQENLEEVLR